VDMQRVREIEDTHRTSAGKTEGKVSWEAWTY